MAGLNFQSLTGQPFGFKTIVAAGTNQATAAALQTYSGMSWFVTGANATKGVLLPKASKGKFVVIKNDDAAAAVLKVYPGTGASINGGSTNAAYSLAAGESALFSAASITGWFVLASAAGGTSSLPALTSAHLFVGNGSGLATDVAVSGDLTLANTGAFTVATLNGTSPFAKDQTYTAASLSASSTTDQLKSKITLTPSTTVVTNGNGFNAFRGEVNLTSGKTLGDGTASYVNGVYGRGNIFGTVNIGSGSLAAVYGKFDLNGSTLTSGHIAPVQSNIVNPGSSAATAGVSLFYGESASGTKIGNGIELYMAANYFMKVTEVGSNFFLTAGTGANSAAVSTGGVAAKVLKMNVGGVDYYLPLFSSNA